MPLLGVAVTAPATRRSLQRRWLVVGALAVAGLALLLAAALRARSDVHAVALQHDGATAGATVVAVDAQPTGRGRSPDGSVVVRFDAAGQSRDASVYVGGAVARYQVGQQVTVVYDPADSTRVELQGITTAGRGIAIVPALVIGALLAAMAVVAGRRASLITRVVRREPWVAVPSRLVQVPRSYGFRQRSRTLVVLDAIDGPVTVEPAGMSRVNPSFSPEAWVAGPGFAMRDHDKGPIVLAAPGGGHVIAVRRQ